MAYAVGKRGVEGLADTLLKLFGKSGGTVKEAPVAGGNWNEVAGGETKWSSYLKNKISYPFLPESWKWKMAPLETSQSSSRSPFSTSMIMGERVSIVQDPSQAISLMMFYGMQ